MGLCHSVQGTAEQLAWDIGVPIDEINYVSAGINHMAFYLQFERKSDGGVEDLYPRIRQVLDEGRVPDWNRVRYEMFKRLGYFVTESSEHFSRECASLVTGVPVCVVVYGVSGMVLLLLMHSKGIVKVLGGRPVGQDLAETENCSNSVCVSELYRAKIRP